MDKYKNKYRNESARAQWWNYGWGASYFITICTSDREHFFGKVRNEKMELSEIGMIADACWREIVNHAIYIELGPHVVMPNHVHGILTLIGGVGWIAGPRHAMSLQPGQMRFQNPGKNTISTIVGGYKSAVSKNVRTSAGTGRLHFGWQSRFHDHIIRDDKEYQRISEYILNNPRNWDNDEFRGRDG